MLLREVIQTRKLISSRKVCMRWKTPHCLYYEFLHYYDNFDAVAFSTKKCENRNFFVYVLNTLFFHSFPNLFSKTISLQVCFSFFKFEFQNFIWKKFSNSKKCKIEFFVFARNKFCSCEKSFNFCFRHFLFVFWYFYLHERKSGF